jgi:gas vesicle protein
MASHADDVTSFPDGMASKPEDVIAMAAHVDEVADFSDGVADTPDDVADSPGDRQAGLGLPLSAFRTGATEETGVKKDAATTTRGQAGPSSAAAIASSSSPSTTPKHTQLKDEIEEQLKEEVGDWFEKRKEWVKNKMELWPKDKRLEDEVQQLVRKEQRAKEEREPVHVQGGVAGRGEGRAVDQFP